MYTTSNYIQYTLVYKSYCTCVDILTALSKAEMSKPSTVPTGARNLYMWSKLTAGKHTTVSRYKIAGILKDTEPVVTVG